MLEDTAARRRHPQINVRYVSVAAHAKGGHWQRDPSLGLVLVAQRLDLALGLSLLEIAKP